MKALLYISLLLSFSCATSLREDDCKELEWKRQGLRDASQGLSQSMFSTYKNNCLQNSSYEAQQRDYNLGYHSGLGQYCNYRIGVMLGESGAMINPNCNQKLYPKFFEGYQQGVKAGKKKALQKKGQSSN